ncbi:MAG TPA: 5-oxoprolinase subunit PxpA [Aestuariivirgaceae bacterium]|nr:5-oxoprolinase subunit PxpA [Aestuariivirgaceae bacterium]
MRININADMGEGFGVYDIGNDTALLEIVKSANVACGFHAGDPTIMRSVVEMAAERGVSLGAHPGFLDLWGFGRRRIEMNSRDLENSIAYQIGALNAIACYSGIKVTHVKPHGSLSNMAAADADYALAIGRAIKAVDPRLRYLALAGSEMEKAAEKLGLPVAREAFIDRQYENDGQLTSRQIPGAVIRDPQKAAERVVAMVHERTIISRQGKSMPTDFHSLCIHGDEPTAVPVALASRKALEASGVKIVTIPEMV